MVSLKVEINEQEFLKAIDEKLDELVDEIFADSQEIIIDKQIVDEGTLLKSGNINRDFLEKEIIYGVPYADSIEFGRLPGSMPPVEPIKRWLVRKGIAIKEPKISNMAWAIAKHIERDGTVPRPFLSPAVEIARNKLRSK